MVCVVFKLKVIGYTEMIASTGRNIQIAMISCKDKGKKCIVMVCKIVLLYLSHFITMYCTPPFTYCCVLCIVSSS